jgi:hypothetical protein
MSSHRHRGNSTNVVLIIVGSVVGLLVLMVLACGGLTFVLLQRASQAMQPQLQAEADRREADGVIQTFLNNLALGQIEAAYGSTTAAFRARQTLPQFKAFVDGNPLLTKFTDAQKAPVNNAPGAQRLTVQYTLTGKGTLQLTFQLVKEGEDWKIDAVTVP